MSWRVRWILTASPTPPDRGAGTADLTGELAFLETLADAARPLALRHFRSGIIAESKTAGSDAEYDPVTAADREVEARLRALIAQHRPGDGVLGEEQAATPSSTGRTFIIDPIDGTRAFIAGLPTWCADCAERA